MFDGNQVSYDLDGNMLSDGVRCFTYDSTNKLITADGHTYTYNAEEVQLPLQMQVEILQILLHMILMASV